MMFCTVLNSFLLVISLPGSMSCDSAQMRGSVFTPMYWKISLFLANSCCVDSSRILFMLSVCLIFTIYFQFLIQIPWNATDVSRIIYRSWYLNCFEYSSSRSMNVWTARVNVPSPVRATTSINYPSSFFRLRTQGSTVGRVIPNSVVLYSRYFMYQFRPLYFMPYNGRLTPRVESGVNAISIGW